jgi:pimeloyl-ACP methyl ester carboxylesterase
VNGDCIVRTGPHRRGWVGIAIVVIAIVASACISSGSGSAHAAERANSSAKFAGLVDIGGRKLYLECRGRGTPTVVLVSGYHEAGSNWSVDLPGLPGPHVLPAVSRFTRVCTYDRPGTDGADAKSDDPVPTRSDPVDQPRAPDAPIKELHALLAAADVPGPYVIAGHSLGGAYVRMYAATYPDEVAGVVLVDATNEYIRDALTPQQWADLAGLSDLATAGQDDPAVEKVDIDTVVTAVAQAVAARPLPQVPFAVVSRGREDELPADVAATFPPGTQEAWGVGWQASQARLAATVPGARHFVATDSGHHIPTQQPAPVIEAIRQVVEGVRHPDTWTDLVACCAA